MAEQIDNYLFFQDPADLAEFGALQAESLENVELIEQNAAARTQAALEQSEAADAKERRAQESASTLSDELVELRKSHERALEEYFTRAFFESDVNHDPPAEESAKRQQKISTISAAVSYGREHLAPTLRLAALTAQEQLFRSSAILSSWSAAKSAVVRHRLAAPLGDSEGAITFSANVGKTAALFEAQLKAHARYARLQQERQQYQRKLGLEKENR